MTWSVGKGTPKNITVASIGVGGVPKEITNAWVGVGGVPKLFYENAVAIIVTNTPSNVSGVTTFDVIVWRGTSNSTTATVNSGTPLSYAWRRVSGSTDITANSPSSATTDFDYVGATSSASATFVCDVDVGGVIYTSANLIASYA